MKITKLVVEVFADQLNQYARNHPGFTFEPPECESIFVTCRHIFLDFLVTIFTYCRSILFWYKLECPICFDDDEELTVMYPCSHIICIPCGRRWFEDKIDHGGTCDTLTCASPNCGSSLSVVNRRKILTDSLRLKLRYNHFIKAVTKIAEENKLACPQPDCPGYFLRLHTNTSSPGYDKDSEFAVCPLCFIHDRVSVYCFKCRKHHSKEEHYALSNMVIYKTNKIMKNWFGMNFDRETESETLVRTLKLVTKKCPACGIPCEKDEACNHCTCLNCGVEFNWAQERLWEGYREEFRRDAVFNNNNNNTHYNGH